MRVRAVRSCFVGRHWKQGEEGEYSGPKNKNLEPVKAPKLEPVKEEAKAEPVKATKVEPVKEVPKPEPVKEEAKTETEAAK